MQRENTLHRVSNRNNGAMSFNETEALGVLTYLDKDELQRLNDNDEKLDDLVNDLQQVRFHNYFKDCKVRPSLVKIKSLAC